MKGSNVSVTILILLMHSDKSQSSMNGFQVVTIGLITVSDVILTGRRSGQKLQCLYGNPMAKNFFQNRILRNL